MAKKSKNSQQRTILIVIILIILVLVLLAAGLVSYYYLGKKNDSPLYYFSFQKGDVWEGATFIKYNQGDGGAHVLFTSSEKKDIEQKLPIWKRKFPSVCNGDILKWMVGNKQIYVDLINSSYMNSFCPSDQGQYLCVRNHHCTTVQPSDSPKQLKEGFFHACCNGDFQKEQTLCQDNPATLISPGFACNNGFGCTQQTICTSACETPITWKNEWYVQLSDHLCPYTSGLFGMSPPELYVEKLKLNPSSEDSYKTSWKGKNLALENLYAQNSFEIIEDAIDDDDGLEFLQFMKRIEIIIISYNMNYKIKYDGDYYFKLGEKNFLIPDKYNPNDLTFRFSFVKAD